MRKPKVKPSKLDTPEEQIAKIRGIEDFETFLNPSQDVLNDPYLMKNIEAVANRIIMAIQRDERIVASFDADADGLTSTSMLIRHLLEYTDNVDYIYNERNHGHGIHEQTRLDFASTDEEMSEEKQYRYDLNTSNLEKISQADLLIIVDSSSNDAKACKKLVDEYGVDIIILDHHGIERENPHVLMVNPQQEGCEYPNKFLSGAGVVFKVLQVMEDTLGQVDPWKYIDLVAVGMYADMMRVDILENRYLIQHGLRNMKNVGLVRILKGAKADFYKLDGDSIGFSIAPMFNGVARMDNIKLAIDILLTDDDTVAKKLRLQMAKLNDKRKEIQKATVERYMSILDTTKKILVVMDDESSKGFNGLVSQQLTDMYSRPAIVGRLHKGTFSGSFRSFGGFDLLQFLKDSALVEEAIGHKQAGGITVLEENVQPLLDYIENNLPELKEKGRVLCYDFEIDVEEMGEYIKAVEKFNKVAGNGFPRIVTRVNKITIEDVDTIGKTMETRKFKTFDDMELIKFKVDENYASELSIFDEIDAVGTIGMNEFYNFKLKEKICTPQVKLTDYRPTE